VSIVRREFLTVGAAGLAVSAFPACAHRLADPTAARNPFTLGVAAGDPQTDGFVIWTRLAPDPLAADGRGGLAGAVGVSWEVAADEAMRTIVRRGRAVADDRYAHSVHVEVAGLAPGRPYWYRFRAQGHESGVGRARTAPAGPSDRLKVAFASCAHWELGWFSGYRHMAAENPDLVLFLGDYIYEYSYKGDKAKARTVRRHDREDDVVDLAGYRNRYALYKTDPDLQAVHAAAACLMTWDDHEVENDYANRWSEHPATPEAAFLARRAAAYRAFYEHMPLRPRSRPAGSDMRVYDRLAFGDLADFTVLDGRQYRTPQPCPTPTFRGGHVANCSALRDPSRTMLGAAQERWLYYGFRDSRARWTMVAQDLLVASLVQTNRDGLTGHFTDGWDGYEANRERMLTALAASGARNPVFLGGDIHSFWTTDLKADFSDPASRTVATEFVGAAISQLPPAGVFDGAAARNPHVKFVDTATNGYVSLDITPTRLDARFQVVSDRRDPKAEIRTLKAFVVEDGRPGALDA
jgi:alkaline phosphatase D